MKKILLVSLVAGLSLLHSKVWAQERTITGTVTSMEDGTSLPGVNVLAKGTTIGSVTDANGKYTITVPYNLESLIFSFIGLETTEVALDGRTVVNVQMANDILQLSEIVVVGFQTMRKTEVTGSVGSVNNNDIKNQTVASFDRAIQGKMAGVQVNASNGVPGGFTQVRIRGVGSVSGSNEPLYIVDGVPITAGDRSRAIISSNVLNGINANDIESIDVLKDAASASIYGAQAANGVIIITTKRGKSGAVKFNANYYYGQSDIIKKQQLLNSQQWLELYEEGQRNFYEPFNAVLGEGANVGLAQTATQANYGTPSAASTYDWQNLVTRRGDIHNVDLTASGGTEKNTFYLSGSYTKQNSQYKATDFTRGSFKVNIDNHLTQKLFTKTSLTFGSVTQNTQGALGLNTNNSLVSAIGRLPMANPYLDNGQVNPNITYAAGPLGANSNPLWVEQVNPQRGTTNQFIGNINVAYDLLEGLTFNSIYSLDYSVVDELTYADPRTPGGAGTNGSIAQLYTRTLNWTTDQTLSFTKTLNDIHKINSLAGFTYRNQITDGFAAQGIAVSNPELRETLQGTTASVVSSVFSQFKLAGLFARLNYTLNDKYILSGIVRRDGSSRFGEGKKYGWFPSVSAAWRIDQENFMGTVGFVDELKIRGGYGIVGNQEIASDFPFSLYGAGVAFGYAGQGGLSFTNLGNPNLQWEEKRETNVGLDLGLFNNRLTTTVDYFIRTTENLLLPQILPSHSGFATLIENVGALENRGWEFAITTQNLAGEFKWTTDFNISLIENKVTRLLNPEEDLPNNGLWLGKPRGQVFTARYAGVNPADGRAMWYDINGNITYNPQEADRVFITKGSGSALLPKYYGGFTNTFAFKGFELSAFFQFNIGQLAPSNFQAATSMDYRFDTNQDIKMYDRWTKPGDITDVPRIMPGAQEPGSANSLFGGAIAGHDRFWEDASYIRLKQVSLSYSFPVTFTQKFKLTSTRLYVQGMNLWTQSRFTGLDPEFAANTNNIGVLPPAKTIIAGIEIGF